MNRGAPETQLHSKVDSQKKKKKAITPNARNPLTDLNTKVISTSSSSLSVEAPRGGCLSFFLSNNSSSSSKTKTPLHHHLHHNHNPKTKTPNSAPISNPHKPISQKVKNITTTPLQNRWQNGKKHTFRSPAPSPHSKTSPDLEETYGDCISKEKLGSWSCLQEHLDKGKGSVPTTGEFTELELIGFGNSCLDDNGHETPVNKLVHRSEFDSTPGKKDNPVTIKTLACFNQWQNGKNRAFKPLATTPHSKTSPDLQGSSVYDISVEKLGSGSCLEESLQKKQWSFSRTRELNELKSVSFGKACLDVNSHTSPANKLVNVFESDSMHTTGTTTTTRTTPPVEASISPEIQFGPYLNSTTPASCFGAGHILSGVTDKRKCRPSGILTVGEELGFGEDGIVVSDDKSDNFIRLLNSSRLSMVPSPTEASVHWLLSPCKEEEDHKDCSQNGSPEFMSPFQSSSPSSSHGFSSDIRGNSNCTSNAHSTARRGCLISPSGQIEFEDFVGYAPMDSEVIPPCDHVVYCSSASPATCSCKAVMWKEGRGHQYELTTKSNPFSADSLGSPNVISTPHSDSSIDRLVQLSWLRNTEDQQECQLELDSMAEILSTTTLSPKNKTSIWDPADVLPLPGFSFQFTRLNSPSNLIDETQLQKTFNDRLFGVSSLSSRESSFSQMRISWREALVSRNFEMDELDCCCCLSGEEEDISFSGDYQFEGDTSYELLQNREEDRTLTENFVSAEFLPENN